MGEASMRKWERRAVEAMVRDNRELAVRSLALHLRLRERKRRRFWRDWGNVVRGRAPESLLVGRWRDV